MNRVERRRAKKAGIPVKKEPVVNIKAADVQKIKQDASKEAADKAFLLMLGLPVMVLHDKFGFGPVRCERFTDAVLELYDSFEKGYVSLEDIHLTLKIVGTKPWQNSEGYSDPTAYEGLKPIIREDEEQQRRLNNLIFVLKYIIRLAGFELLNRIELKDKRNGREFK